MAAKLEFAVTHVIPAPNDAVWRVLGNFGTEHRWVRNLSRCTRDTADIRVGTVRRCCLPRPLMGRNEVRETLTELEPDRTLAYRLEGAAGPFATAASRWTTADSGPDATAVTVAGTFEPRGRVALVAWPVVKPMLRRVARQTVRELEAFLLSSSVAAGTTGSAHGARGS